MFRGFAEIDLPSMIPMGMGDWCSPVAHNGRQGSIEMSETNEKRESKTLSNRRLRLIWRLAALLVCKRDFPRAEWLPAHWPCRQYLPEFWSGRKK